MDKKIEVLVVFEILEQERKTDLEACEKYLKKEGFSKVKDEEGAYQGFGTTAIMNIRAFIFSVFSKAFELGGFSKCKLICQIGKNDFEAYMYKKNEIFFEEIRI